MAATITYAFPVVGTFPPTAFNAFNSVSAQVVFADADTTALVTHNWNLTTTQLANLWPWVNAYPAVLGTATVAVQVGVALTNSVAVTLSKAVTSAGSSATYNVILQRPHSMIT